MPTHLSDRSLDMTFSGKAYQSLYSFTYPFFSPLFIFPSLLEYSYQAADLLLHLPFIHSLATCARCCSGLWGYSRE